MQSKEKRDGSSKEGAAKCADGEDGGATELVIMHV